MTMTSTKPQEQGTPIRSKSPKLAGRPTPASPASAQRSSISAEAFGTLRVALVAQIPALLDTLGCDSSGRVAPCGNPSQVVRKCREPNRVPNRRSIARRKRARDWSRSLWGTGRRALRSGRCAWRCHQIDAELTDGRRRAARPRPASLSERLRRGANAPAPKRWACRIGAFHPLARCPGNRDLLRCSHGIRNADHAIALWQQLASASSHIGAQSSPRFRPIPANVWTARTLRCKHIGDRICCGSIEDARRRRRPCPL